MPGSRPLFSSCRFLPIGFAAFAIVSFLLRLLMLTAALLGCRCKLIALGNWTSVDAAVAALVASYHVPEFICEGARRR